MANRREQQDEIITAALERGASYAEAAELAGTSARTVRRRMADDEFRIEVFGRRAERAGQVTGELIRASADAVGVLEACLQSESESVQLRAAQTLIELGHKLRAAHDLEERVRRLERQTGASRG
jgi:hypothetical protein